MRRATQLLASFLSLVVITIVGVLFFFRPIAESDAGVAPWPAPVALAVYAGLSILVLDWGARRTGSSYSAAFIVAASQAIFIIDLLSRGERGLLTAAAGLILVALTWTAVAFVHSRLSER